MVVKTEVGVCLRNMSLFVYLSDCMSVFLTETVFTSGSIFLILNGKTLKRLFKMFLFSILAGIVTGFRLTAALVLAIILKWYL